MAKWDAKCLYIIGGIQPVANNGPLDLIERSMLTSNYKNAALVGWPVGTNGNMAGLKFGAPILKEGFKLGAELFTSVTAPRTEVIAKTPKSVMSATMLLLDLPMSMAALTLTPQVVAILNRNYNAATEQGDNEMGFGFGAGYKVWDGFTLSASLGLAMLANTKGGVGAVTTTTKDTVDPVTNYLVRTSKNDTAKEYKENGMVFGVGGVYKIGPGSAMLDIKYSTDEDKNIANSKSSYVFTDAKYAWDLNKNFQFIPRVRLFLNQFDTTPAQKVKSNMEIRPELIFSGKF
jgi:hypothetical protein